MSEGPELTPEDVKEILRLVDESRFDEFELETPRFSVRFSRAVEAAVDATPERMTAVERESTARAANGLVDVAAPMVGTLYRGPGPAEPPFVEVGSRVEQGAQLCIIEVMKLMNSVNSTLGGTVAEVCVENGAAVQYGDVLFRIQPDA